MKTNGIEILLIGMTVSTLSLTLFIYLGNRILNVLKISASPKVKQGMRNIEAAKLENKNMRKKIVSKPNIICALPIHQESRPEAPLS
jgi:hypothetical protein